MMSWLLAMPGPTIMLGCHILPPTNHLKAGRDDSTSSSRAIRFTGPHKNPTSGHYKSNLAIVAKMALSLINIGGDYHLGTWE
jgi:hypothetical protein